MVVECLLLGGQLLVSLGDFGFERIEDNYLLLVLEYFFVFSAQLNETLLASKVLAS